jgi:hypothetical protein
MWVIPGHKDLMVLQGFVVQLVQSDLLVCPEPQDQLDFLDRQVPLVNPAPVVHPGIMDLLVSLELLVLLDPVEPQALQDLVDCRECLGLVV